jgi:hypothetical protein
MKHPSTRELFEYWNGRRGQRPAPERGEIEPTSIRRVLADTFILTVDEGTGHPFRIAGTRVCALFNRELRGVGLLGLWTRDSRELVRDLVMTVGHESVGVVAGATASPTGISHERIELELLVLPLRHHGRTDTRVIGAFSPLEVPYWLGAQTLGPLTLGSFRYLGASVAPRAAPAIAPRLPHGRIMHGLVVYDGGQA